MKKLLTSIFILGLIFSAGIYYGDNVSALNSGAESGFKAGLEKAGGNVAEDCKNAGGTVQGDQCVDGNGASTNPVSLMLVNVINLLLYIAGIIAVIIIVVAGIRFVTSNGDSGATNKARNEIIYALVGLAIATLAYVLVNFILKNII